MINSLEKPKTFQPYVDTLLEDVYDTYKGIPIHIPSKYMVRVTSKPAPQYLKCSCIDPKLGKTVFFTAHTDTLKSTHLEILKEDAADESLLSNPVMTGIPPVGSGPKVLRIYQEYGATFLIYKQAAILADAPGVGKTLQALIASHRVTLALEQKIDPLNLCYTTKFQDDENNHHPITRPEWATPQPIWHTSTPNKWGIKVSTKLQNNFYWGSYQPVVVIVAPNHLTNMWYREIRSQFPDEHVAVATHDTKANRLSVLKPGCRFYVVSYEMMRKAKPPKDSDYTSETVDYHLKGETYHVKEKKLKPEYVKPYTYLDALTALNPVCVIYDESHKLKSSKSKQARACAEFSETIPYRFLLSATPIKKEADDLHWQLHIVDPMNFAANKYSKFCEDYCVFVQGSYRKMNLQLKDPIKRKFWFNRIGTQAEIDREFNTLNMFTKLSNKKYDVSFTNPNLNGYILGRSYKDVGIYLPRVIPATIPVLMNTECRIIYDNMIANYRADFGDEAIEINSLMALLHSMRIMTVCPNKLEKVKELVEEGDSEGPYVIFCEYKPSGEYLSKMFDTTFISGAIKDYEREEVIDKLLDEGKVIVGLGSVIGTGINALARCNTIINFEADYTPGERTQRIGRVQRFSAIREAKVKETGEDQPIILYDVVVTDSIDEKVFEIQRNRGKSIADIIKVELGLSK